jgi:uncharacterized protein YneF (UPF0154 family)
MIELFLNLPIELQILILFGLIGGAWFVIKGNNKIKKYKNENEK